MTTTFTIGQLASKADVPTSTIRYYERRKLLHPNSRSLGNYRLYDEQTLERLLFIRSSQKVGFTLGDIESLLKFRDGNGKPCSDVQHLITSRLQQVHDERKHLKRVDRLLTQWLKICTTVCKDGKCGVIDGLNAPNSK
ncbi:MAG TPA: MerR family transcriptional regulator [Phycisphaerales bacterium]|nr:MerR family transcriptional regulator [Phycisphaerales bacterium]